MATTDNIGISYLNAITLGVVLSFLLQKGSCLSCWECNSKYNPNCGEPFKNQTLQLVDCNQKFLPHYPDMPGKICRKLTQKVKTDVRVIRGCGFLDAEGPMECMNRAGTHQVFMQYCQCRNADGCNAAKALLTRDWLLPLSALLLLTAQTVRRIS